MSRELEQGRQRSEAVTQDLGQVLEELRTARLESHESKRQLQRKELLEKLFRLYPQAVVGGAQRRHIREGSWKRSLSVRNRDLLLYSSMVDCLTCAAPSIGGTSWLSPRCLAATSTRLSYPQRKWPVSVLVSSRMSEPNLRPSCPSITWT